LYYWACAALSFPFGLNEATLRGVSVAAAIGTLAVAGWLAGLLGSRRASALAIVALGSNMAFADLARKGMVDMAFAFFVTAALAVYVAARVGRMKPWIAAALGGAAAGLAVLTKGPLGVVLPAAAIAGDLLLVTRGRFWRARIPWGPGALSFAIAVALPLLW